MVDRFYIVNWERWAKYKWDIISNSHHLACSSELNKKLIHNYHHSVLTPTENKNGNCNILYAYQDTYLPSNLEFIFWDNNLFRPLTPDNHSSLGWIIKSKTNITNFLKCYISSACVAFLLILQKSWINKNKQYRNNHDLSGIENTTHVYYFIYSSSSKLINIWNHNNAEFKGRLLTYFNNQFVQHCCYVNCNVLMSMQYVIYRCKKRK